MPDRPLRVGLNLIYLQERSGGMGTYARELIHGLLEVEPRTRITAFTSTEAPNWLRELEVAGALDRVEIPLTVSHGPPGNYTRLVAAQWLKLPWTGARRRLDVIHGLANVGTLAGPRVARVVTVHDLIWLHYPETMSRGEGLGMRMTTRPSVRRAHRVLTVSEAVKADLVATWGVDARRVDVTLLGVRPPTPTGTPTPEPVLRERLGLGDAPVILTVGQKRRHKNQLALIRALPVMADQRPVLVLAGPAGDFEDALRAEAQALGVADRVVIAEWLEPEELEGLYGLATCFVLPSLQEGFGLPVLEAMSREIPVACSNTSSLPEVAGDAALTFDPLDHRAVAATLDRLLADAGLRATLRERGLARAGAFTWRDTAELTLDSYRRAMHQIRSA